MNNRLRSLWDKTAQPTTQRSFRCQCGRPVFFRNSRCLACKTELGYEVAAGCVVSIEPLPPLADNLPATVPMNDPATSLLVPAAMSNDAAMQPVEQMQSRQHMQPGLADANPTNGAPVASDSDLAQGLWRRYGDPQSPVFRRCSNFATASGCNWLVPAGFNGAPDGGFCVACKLNRTIPDQSDPFSRELWAKIELAKRRLVSSLIALGLPVQAKESDDPERGLAFDFLRALPGQPPVMTGHANGIITINIEEADDAKREQIRIAMREPYRTLLGHFRHEVGHYYWDRLVWNSPWLEPYRYLFGDERVDYATALRNHYENGPPAEWPKHFVSSYASTHPWEDWAESSAHYLHMVDTMDTALSFGLGGSDVELDHDPYVLDDLWQPQAANAQEFLGFINAWIRIAGVITELTRSMGQPDFYPFALPRSAVAKLHFIHTVIQGSAQGGNYG